jgi:hypothetical protein
MSSVTSRRLVVLMAALSALCAPSLTAQPTAIAAGSVLTELPQRPDPATRYVVYLHGRIVEEQGRAAVSTEFGAYQFDAILAALARPGIAVIGEVREKDADAKRTATHIATGVERLIDAGVPARNVTVLGASKGALIAMLASTALAQRDVGWILLGSCNEWVTKNFEIALHGRVLSIYESSDETGRSCGSIFEQSPDVARRHEIRLDTGLRHGYLYRPLDEWVKPALAWIERKEN